MRREPAGTDPPEPSTDRRSFLGCLALLGYGRYPEYGTGSERGDELRHRDDGDANLTVMARNLYLGVELSRLFRARSEADVRRIAGRMLEDVERRPFPPRAVAIADEIAATRPDVVGVQEAALVRTQETSDFAIDPAPNAQEGVVDFLAVLVEALSDQGMEYSVAASVVTSDVEVPADVDGHVVDARLTDRDALLVRDGVDVDEIRTGTFEASLEVPVEGNRVSIDRGYVTAAVAVDGLDATVATTHLESADPTVRLRQARELLDVLPPEGPVVLAGDVNSGPGASRGAHDLLIESLDDVHATLRPDVDGFTCCQAADLRNDRSRLSRRVDVILSRGLEPTAVGRVGEDPDDRVSVAADGTPARQWPSDHAGVVATLEATTSPDADVEPGTTLSGPTTPAPTRSPSGSRGERTTTPPTAGFGLVASLLAVLVGAIARRLR